MNLAEEMAKLPEPPNGAWPDWSMFRNELWHAAQKKAPETYASWGVVHHNFLSSWLDIEQAWALVNLSRHRQAIMHPPFEIGDFYRGRYSRHMVKLCGWLAFWENASGRKVSELDTIFEFGAGLGAMALVCRTLGFQGRYAIYDFPECQVFQKWWLDREGVRADFVRESEKCDLFIALSSLSETYLDFRDTFPITARNCLLEYQDEYDYVDNMKWFGEFFDGSGLEWRHMVQRQEHMHLSAGWMP